MAASPSPRQRLGRLGEDLAVAHLTRLGYRVLARNHRCQLGEIDIVASEGDCLVIVEVRARRGSGHGTPEESITLSKQERLRRLAEAYVQGLSEPPAAYRVDLVAVELSPAGQLLRTTLIRDALA
ncbi:MAG: YraN family protein [Chloroflexota bacterium]